MYRGGDRQGDERDLISMPERAVMRHRQDSETAPSGVFPPRTVCPLYT